MKERAGVPVHRFVGRLNAHVPVEDEEQRRLLDAVVAERLTGTQLDQDGPLGALPRVEDDRRPRAVRCLDLGKSPVPHG